MRVGIRITTVAACWERGWESGSGFRCGRLRCITWGGTGADGADEAGEHACSDLSARGRRGGAGDDEGRVGTQTGDVRAICVAGRFSADLRCAARGGASAGEVRLWAGSAPGADELRTLAVVDERAGSEREIRRISEFVSFQNLVSFWSRELSKRLLLVAYPLLPVSEASAGGAEQILWTLERELLARGWETVVAACAGS